ncbi:hypothetical protein ACFQ58_02575 [Agromyces sp. NPDC056523]|uniref:hypothetical protein n=1 Tax=Agromyces sp. NPDC056523 TaxID=3345850 RepID=UPI003670277F
MTAPRTYTAEDALAITAFPLSDDVGYIVRVGDTDHDGVVLGTVFFAGGHWQAYTADAVEAVPTLLGSGEDLDDLIVEYFLSKVRLTDEP